MALWSIKNDNDHVMIIRAFDIDGAIEKWIKAKDFNLLEDIKSIDLLCQEEDFIE